MLKLSEIELEMRTFVESYGSTDRIRNENICGIIW